MILDLHRQGLTVSAIARELGVDRKTVRKCIARGLEPPVYGPRMPRQRLIDPFVAYLRERVTAYPGLTGRRLLRECRERGYEGRYTAVTDALRELRPARLPAFEVRFETPPGDQAQVDFAQFQLQFTDEPAVTRIVWLFSFVLGFSRLIWARFVLHQDMQTVLRCHMAAFEAIGALVDKADVTLSDTEGCLSLQGVSIPVERSVKVTIEAKDENGEDVRLDGAIRMAPR